MPYIHGLNLASHYSLSVPMELYLKLSIIEEYIKILNIFFIFMKQYHKCEVYLLQPPYLLQLWLMSFLPRAAWNSFRRNFVGCDTGVRPEQTNTDLSGLRLEERGFRVKRVALAATGTPRLKANKSRHISSPLLTDLSARRLPLYSPILRSPTFTSALNAEELRIRIWSIGYFLIRIFLSLNDKDILDQN